MVDVTKISNKTPSIPLYDPSLLQVIANNEIVSYRVKLLSGINYVRLFFAGLLLLYFYAVKKDINNISILFQGTGHDYNLLQLFWTLYSSYILSLLLCNIALMYKYAWKWIFIVMAYAEVLLLTILLSLVFTRQLANVNMMLIICSLLLSVLTLTYIESVVLSITLGLMMFFYSVMTLINPQLNLEIYYQAALFEKLSMIWQAIKDNQLELLDPTIYSASLALIIIMVGLLASQARDNKIISRLSNLYNEQLHKINNSIIEDVKSGLIVVNAKGVILTLNHQAKRIFNLPIKAIPPTLLANLSTELSVNFNRWQYVQFSDDRNHIEIGQNAYSVSFNLLQQHENIDLTLITLESVEDSMQRIREARLVSLGRLSAGIAHEIRNPLASIQSAADILAELTENEQTQFLVGKITKNTKRVNTIVSDVLNMFNEEPRERQLIHLNTEIEKIIEQARQDTLTKEAAIKLDLKESKPFFVYFDRGHLSQVMNNLIINALTHGDVDNIEMTICSQVSRIGRQIYLDISDNGKGVPESDQDKIFEPFFSKKNGTGLGLYLVREMCLANQAQIVYIRHDKGACFRITLERYLSDEVSADEV